MFDLGWGEMMLIGIVALVVVGPKELPGLFRSIGVAVGKARGLAREFSRAMEAAADESGMKDIDRTIRAATRPVQFATDRLREQTGLAQKRTGAAIPAAGTPLTTTGAPVAPSVPLDPGPPLAAPAVPSPTATITATDALAQRRSEERAERTRAAAERHAAALAQGPTPTDGTP